MTKDERIADFAYTFEDFHGAAALKYLSNSALMAYLNDGGFFTAPASTKYHSAYEGGLYDHQREVMFSLEDITDYMGLKWEREESPFIVGMFHDVCKCDQYKLQDGVYVYNDSTLLKGHGSKSVMVLSQFFTLTEEEMLCIRYHMGAYEKDDWDGYDMAIRKYPNVLWTHTADMYASKVKGI